MVRNVDYWYEQYGPGRMLVDNITDPEKKELSESEKKKKAKKYDKKILEDKNCIRRLMKDIKELAMCSGDFPNVSAAPLEDNIYLWHANVTAPDGPLKGLCVHLELQFPSSYPRNPPRIKCLTPIRHPNIFGSYICCTMLAKRKYNDDPNEGWTGAYSVASILLQLQSFLFSDNVPQEAWPGEKEYSRSNYIQQTSTQRLACFRCKRCCHTGTRPHPPIGFKMDHEFLSDKERLSHEWEHFQATCSKKEKIHHKQARAAAKRDWIQTRLKAIEDAEAVVKTREPAFPKKAAHVLVSFLDPYEILMVAMLYPTWDTVNDTHNIRDKYESSCFFTKLDYREAALGYGVRVQYDPFKKKEIRQLSSDLDLISWHGWKKLKHRISAWGNECDLYIPLVLNDSHMRNSGKLMWQQLHKLAGVNESDDDHDERVLDAICALMNSMVVGMTQIKGEVRMYHSEKAMQGYCRFHQLLVHICNERPAIRELAETKVHNFIKNPRSRHKKGGTPDLGRLLVMLSVSDKYGWEDIKRPFFEEVTVRQQKWNIIGCPTLRFDCDTRTYGTWFRAMKPLEVLAQPKFDSVGATNRNGKPVFKPKEGELCYGRTLSNGWIKIDTPCSGYVHNTPWTPKTPKAETTLDINTQLSSEDIEKVDTLQELPFHYPALCITKRAAAGRLKASKTSRWMRNIEARTFVVVLDVIGNRALVASVIPGKEGTTALKRKQSYAVFKKTIYGNLLMECEMSKNGNPKPRQDAVWVSLNTAKGPLLEKVDINDDWRLDESFKHTHVSRQLIMFQKAFLDVIKEGNTLEEISAAYLSKWGNPPKGSLPTLHSQVKDIKQSKTWNEYLSFLNLPFLSKPDMIELLKRSVALSERKRYTHSFHTGYDEIPDTKKHKPTKGPSKSFKDEDLPEEYVSRYARKPRPRDGSHKPRRRRYERDSDSGSSEDTVFNPLVHRVIKPFTPHYPKSLATQSKRMNNGRVSFFKGDLYALFCPGLPKNCLAADVQSHLRSLLPRHSFVRVPRDDADQCRGFAFIDVLSLESATYLVKNGIKIDKVTVRPRFARQK